MRSAINKLLMLIGLLVPNLAQALDCENLPAKLTDLLVPENVLLFGELHGTNEMPRRFFDVACAASRAGMGVNVGIEAPSEYSEYYQSLLNPENLSNQLNGLMTLNFWAQDYQDGRASSAMFELIKNLQKLGAENDNVYIFTFDRQGKNRDRRMANDFIANNGPQPLTIALTGNIHSRTTHGISWDSSRGNMGAYIKESNNHTVSIYMSHSGGDAWLCTPECGIKTLANPDAEEHGDFKISMSENGHDWSWWIGEISASLPARSNSEINDNKVP